MEARPQTAETPTPSAEGLLSAEEYLPFVRKVARRVANRLPRNVELQELVNAGTVGLMEALGRYDAAGGRSFETYAEFRIKGAIYDDLRRIDPVKRSTRAMQARLGAVQAKLAQELGRAPERDELAAALDIDVAEVEEQLARANRGEVALAEGAQLVAADQPDPEEIVSQKRRVFQVRDAITDLTERQQTVLSLYYVEELSQQEIGTILGVTESRVCQILSQLRRKLRSFLRRREN
jgi:RNA polymerase sigma factor for flagellar operon FliA